MFEQRKGAVLVVVLYKSYCSRQKDPTKFKVSNIRLEVEDYGLKFTKRKRDWTNWLQQSLPANHKKHNIPMNQ